MTEKDINYIQVGRTRQTLKQPKWVEKWHIKNKPEQSAAIPQTNDGMLHYLNIEEWLRPEIDFTFNFLSPEDYAEAEQLLTLGAFVCRFFNPAIMKWFTGLFKLTESSLSLFLRTYGNTYSGVIGYRFKARSIYTYDTYEHLANKAEEDSRF